VRNWKVDLVDRVSCDVENLPQVGAQKLCKMRRARCWQKIWQKRADDGRIAGWNFP
jgi:hypothetical protein